MSKTVAKNVNPELYDVILSPVVTEKSQSGLASNKYVFKVAPDANKQKVRQAVSAVFGAEVTVEKVNIVVIKGKNKLFRGRPGKRKDVKKAIITLAKGQSIDVSSKI